MADFAEQAVDSASARDEDVEREEEEGPLDDEGANGESTAVASGGKKRRKKKKKKKKPSVIETAANGDNAEENTSDQFQDISGDGGVLKRVLEAGVGEVPPLGSYVRAHYVGTLEDGSQFDSSHDRDKEFVFQLGKQQVIKAWEIAFATMPAGEKAVLRCAPDYAYGELGYASAIPPNATLTFEVENLGFYQRQCITTSCANEATMQCPKCVTLGIPGSYFCSQSCFRDFWPTHKRVHKIAVRAQRDDAMPPEFRGYTGWTSELRPWARGSRRDVPDHIVKPDYAAGGLPISEMQDKRSNKRIYVHNAEEIENVRNAARIAREILDAGGQAVAVGTTCDEIDRIIHEATIERGAYPSPLNYHSFPKSVCTSVNEVICHGIPDKRPLQDGDIVNIDVTAYVNGVHADLNETFLVGNVDEDGRKLVRCAFECLQVAVEMCRPGVDYCDLGAAITRRAKQSKCSVVRSYCGHGIGALFHTSPNIPHYAKNKAKGTMKVGHIFTIEPMVNLGGHEDTTWPDNWTAVTRDGSRSAQFEHTLVITQSGVEILTAREDEPMMVWDEAKVQRW